MPPGGYPGRQAARRFARNASEGQSPESKPRRAQSRSNGAELPAAAIDAPVGKNLESRRVAPHGRKRGTRSNAACRELGNPGITEVAGWSSRDDIARTGWEAVRPSCAVKLGGSHSPVGPQRQGVAPWPGRWRGVASRAQPVCPLTELWRSAWQRRAKAPDGFDSILRGGRLSPANLENRIKSIGSRCKWPHVTEAGRMRRTPLGGYSKRRAAKRFARSADEGQSPKLKSRHARSRSNGAELPAAE